jgi:cell fate regulator YaaT (PSP1 superfamily)
MRLLGAMSARSDMVCPRGTKVIVRTTRGLEVGEVLCAAPPSVEGAESDSQSASTVGQILREMSGQDANELPYIETNARQEFRLCQRHVEELALDMQLVDVEHLFGGERIIVYYLAEGRIDFRELVRRLATEFQTRIEMRQIGVRDEAKLLADYGDCGKTVCCNSHLIEMPPVSMKMAKLQKATLDPTKISGRCGRLKCCLRYEYDTYLDLQRELPPVNSEIVTQQGRARVLGHEILAQQLLVQMEDNRRQLIGTGEVVSVIRKSNKGKTRD